MVVRCDLATADTARESDDEAAGAPSQQTRQQHERSAAHYTHP